MCTRIGFIGAPSAGKTTVAQAFAPQLRTQTGKRVELIDEYARWFVSKFGRPTVFDQYLISNHQLVKERAVADTDFVVVDSPAFLSIVYGLRVMEWDDPKQVHCLTALYNLLADNIHSYDYLFYFSPESKAEPDDGARIHKNTEIIKSLDEEIIAFMRLHKVPYVTLSGTLNRRVADALNGVNAQ